MSELKGNQLLGLHRQTGDTLVQREDGSWEGTVKYICRWANSISFAPKRNIARHPDFTALICSSCQVNRLKPGVVCELNVTYRGLLGTAPDPEDLDRSTEEVITSTSEAPIETHPRFVSTLGGTKAAPLNGAVFNDDGTFKGWKADSPYAGKEAFLIPSTVYRKTTPSRTRPLNIGPVGTIVSPGIGGGQVGSNWLYTCKTWRRDGGLYEVSEEYMLSGPGGWDSTIYS